jgi:hypothetical protein
MDESGTGILLPDNVWFIGTANQDESTMEFADKTYNRAYVLELPAKRPFAPGNGNVEPYSVRALRRSFETAQQQYRAELKLVKDLLAGIAEDLYEVGRIQVDNRLSAWPNVLSVTRPSRCRST